LSGTESGDGCCIESSSGSSETRKSGSSDYCIVIVERSLREEIERIRCVLRGRRRTLVILIRSMLWLLVRVMLLSVRMRGEVSEMRSGMRRESRRLMLRWSLERVGTLWREEVMRVRTRMRLRMMKSVRREMRGWLMLGRSVENRRMSKIVRMMSVRVMELSWLFVGMRLRRR